MATEPARLRFSVDRYERMVEAGILTEDDRVELVSGEIVEMTPIDPAHAHAVDALTLLLVEGVRRQAVVRVQHPVRLPPDSEPEPDVALARSKAEGYHRRHPEPPDILLVVEVARTSLLYDRNVKSLLYARHGIPEAWLVDLAGWRIEVQREPGPDGYERIETVGKGGSVSPLAFPDLVVAVDDILPPAPNET